LEACNQYEYRDCLASIWAIADSEAKGLKKPFFYAEEESEPENFKTILPMFRLQTKIRVTLNRVLNVTLLFLGLTKGPRVCTLGRPSLPVWGHR
jgi:uncharacterized membrane protein